MENSRFQDNPRGLSARISRSYCRGPDVSQIGELIRQYREESNLSRRALARAAGLDPAGLRRIEEDHQRPRGTTIIKLIEAFGWPFSDERAQRLLAFLGSGHMLLPARDVVLGSPISLAPELNTTGSSVTIRELKRTLVRALELINELESEA